MGLFKKLFGSNENKEPQKESNSQNPLDAYNKTPWMTDTRRHSVSTCLDAGFRPTTSLPTVLGRQLRPSLEIASRLHAIKALVLWLMVPEDNLPTDKILTFVDQNNLKKFMTTEEEAILQVSRDDQQARNAIGWKFENAWPLAWYFGYKEPEITGQMMAGGQMQDILINYTSKLDQSVEAWVQSKETVTEQSLLQKEDMFYCLHNAVRSAQLGGNTVPGGFDPVGNGGVIHERRHSLTWMLSDGVNWEETDLST